MATFGLQVYDIVRGGNFGVTYKNLHFYRSNRIDGYKLKVSLGSEPFDAAHRVYQNIKNSLEIGIYDDADTPILLESLVDQNESWTLARIKNYLDQGKTILIDADTILLTFKPTSKDGKNEYLIYTYETNKYRTNQALLNDVYQDIIFELDLYEKWHAIEQKRLIFRTLPILNRYFVNDLSQEILMYL